MYVKVKVTPMAKKEVFVEKTKDHFDVSVKEPAKMNMANRRVVELVAKNYNLPVGRVRIISGHHSRSKILSVDV